MSETIEKDDARLLTAAEREAADLTTSTVMRSQLGRAASNAAKTAIFHQTGTRSMMKSGFAVAALAALAVAGPAAPADAKGCIKGALLGGVAGHYAGHGVLGAVGGCVVGRRVANERAARDRAAQQAVPYDGSSSRDSSYSPVPNDPRYSGTNASASGSNDSNLGSLYNGGAYRR